MGGRLGGLTVALQPMFAQMGGAVNNDVLLFLMATLELYVLARIWRRGMSLTNAVAAEPPGPGILAKPTMSPSCRSWRPCSCTSSFGIGGACGRSPPVGRSACVPFLVLLVLNYGGLGGLRRAWRNFDEHDARGRDAHLPEFLSYLWQWYLPRLPFMYSDFWSRSYLHVSFPLYDLFFKGFWADFGHLEIDFPGWVYGILIAVSVAVLALVVLAAIRARPRREVLAAGLLLGVLPVVMTALLVNARSYLTLIESNKPSLRVGTSFRRLACWEPLSRLPPSAWESGVDQNLRRGNGRVSCRLQRLLARARARSLLHLSTIDPAVGPQRRTPRSRRAARRADLRGARRPLPARGAARQGATRAGCGLRRGLRDGAARRRRSGERRRRGRGRAHDRARP